MERGSDVTEKKSHCALFSHFGTELFVISNEMKYTIDEHLAAFALEENTQR
jgi:hypothetical protein